MNSYQLLPIGYLLAFLVVFYFHGAFLSQNFSFHNRLESVFLRLGLGFAFVLMLTFLVLALNLLSVPFVMLLFSIFPALYFYQQRKNSSSEKSFKLKNLITGFVIFSPLIIIIIYLVLPEIYRIFLPDRGSDSVRYHLPYAKFYVENSGLAVNEFLRYPLHSHNFNLAFVLGFLFLGDIQGEVLSRLFVLFSYCMLIMGTYLLVYRSLGNAVASIAAGLLASVTLFHLQTMNGLVDIGFGLFVFCSIYFIHLMYEDQRPIHLIFSAFMLGMALGTKYLGFLLLLPLTLWVYSINWNKKQATQFFFLTLLFGSPWYIRNVLIAGNPIHPFAQDLFGYWLWDPIDMQGQKTDLLDKRGVKKSLLNFLQWPYLIQNHDYLSRISLGAPVAFALPMLLWSIKMSRFYKALAVFLLFNTAFWFFTTQINRYLIFAIPFLMIYLAAPFGALLSPLLNSKLWKNAAVFKSILAVLFVIYACVLTSKYYSKTDKWLPLPENETDWESYVLKQNPYYFFVNHLNSIGAKRLFNLSDANLDNTFDGQVLGDWFGVAKKRDIFDKCKTEECVLTVLNKFNTRYLLINKTKPWYNRINKVIENSSILTPILSNDDAVLYRLNSQNAK